HDLLSNYAGCATPPTPPPQPTAQLLRSAASSRDLKVRQHPENGFFVEGLAAHPATDATTIMTMLAAGMQRRATAETRLNEHSSRSHAIFQLRLSCEFLEEAADGTVLTHKRSSKISLVDLAGSEKTKESGAVGDRFKEASNINTSLSVLGRIMRELAEASGSAQKAKPAYRESVLTQLLSDSIGGNSVTIMIATVSPSRHNYATSLNTLRFAGQAQRIVNVVHVNEERETAKVVADLRRANAQLTLELEAVRAAGGAAGGPAGAAAAKKEIAALTERLQVAQTRCRLLEAKLQEGGGEVGERLRKSEAAAAQLERDAARARVENQSTLRSLRADLQDKDAQIERLLAEGRAKDQRLADLERRVCIDEASGGYSADKAA
ncbi:MAG: hypothetical protein Q8J97_15095, partial [Flavobacteriaceae bacterium]|nr:hypothetical protein [Flavobacteriaceae bacterium]